MSLTPNEKTDYGSSVHDRRLVAKERIVKKRTKPSEKDEMREEYPSELIRSGVRGKYAERFKAGTNLVLLDPDVAKVFPTPDSVNQALRALIRISESIK